MEIEMFHGGKMNRCIIIQMQSYATQSLGVKCANASLCAAHELRNTAGGGKNKHLLVVLQRNRNLQIKWNNCHILSK